MVEKQEKPKTSFLISLTPQFKKNLFFFLTYSLFLLLLTSSTHSFSWLFLGFLSIVLWKVFFGLSWFNFNFFLLGLILIKILASFFNTFWLLLIAVFLLFLLFEKVFNTNLKQSSFWRLFIFYYLFFFWIFSSLGIYFFLNLPFLLGFVIFILGLIIFSWIYFIMKGRKFFPSGLIVILLNAEFFWLINYLTLPVPFLALLVFLNYWLILYYSYRFKVS